MILGVNKSLHLIAITLRSIAISEFQRYTKQNKELIMSIELEIDECVTVKKGTKDPDFGVDISGWQGRIEENEFNGIVLIRWDSFTLQHMSFESILKSEKEKLDWELMRLNEDEVEKTECHDTPEDISNMVRLLQKNITDYLKNEKKIV